MALYRESFNVGARAKVKTVKVSSGASDGVFAKVPRYSSGAHVWLWYAQAAPGTAGTPTEYCRLRFTSNARESVRASVDNALEW